MSLNNKGFAISGVLYSLLILFVTLFIGILTIFATTKFSFDKVKNDIISKLEPKTLKDIVTTSDENPSIPDCVTNNTECSAGTCMAIKVSDGDTYNFCVMSEDTENNKITLLMDRNLDGTVAWSNNDNSEGPVVALAYLKTQTSGWTNIPETTYNLTDYNSTPQYNTIKNITARARLITKSETDTLLSLSDNSWVYGNLSFSEAPYGYWTSSAYAGSSGSAWGVDSVGYHSGGLVNIGSLYGIRPVITLKKS